VAPGGPMPPPGVAPGGAPPGVIGGMMPRRPPMGYPGPGGVTGGGRGFGGRAPMGGMRRRF